MAKYIVIVESPSKAKTIKKFLGSNYKVEASMGHLRDLPKSQFGVDVDNNFEPKYINIRGKGDLIKQLKKDCKGMQKVFLATDPDREGEAISWHLSKILGISEDEDCRVTFNEITKDTVKKSIKNPRKINLNLVNAQQARRILDRIVGYKISPLLWKNVKKGLSAGRVQSAALKIIVEREQQIEKFIPEEYWTLDSKLRKDRKELVAKFYGVDSKKIELKSKEQVDKIESELENTNFIVKNVRKTEKKKNSLPPFTTSAMQQEAYKKLGFTAKKTMIIAQQLYEGIDLKDGAVGLITYMRTDSIRISDEATESAKEYIKQNYGIEYLPKEPKKYKIKAEAQDAHEAIRPSDISKNPDDIKEFLKPEQYKLYKLIYHRFLASQMENAIFDTVSVDIQAEKYIFKISGSKVKFDGFLKVYSANEENEENVDLPELNIGDSLKLLSLDKKQHFTQPPARYTDASLVKVLEENGIGRPSTYVPIIETIIERGYVIREKKVLNPTELGLIVNEVLLEFFSDVLNEEFTADMEKNLDEIGIGEYDWIKILADFYGPFKEKLKLAEENMQQSSYVEEDQVSDVKCEKCGRNMVIKNGRFGKFLACPGFPECKNTKPYYEPIGIKCPKCGGDIVQKRSAKKGIRYYACIAEECKVAFWGIPIGEKCPVCGDELIKANKLIKCNSSKCKYKKKLEEDEEAKEN